MKSLFLLLPLLRRAFSLDSGAATRPELDPDIPIYLGEIFWPPSMTFMAWLPSEVQKPLEVRVKDLTQYNRKQLPYYPFLDWCYKATDASDNKLFSLNSVDALQIHDYFADQAYITREGQRYADCWVTPESQRIGACQGVLDFDCEGGHKFTGPGTRKWSCWVIPEKVASVTTGEEPQESPRGMLTSGDGVQATVTTGAMASGSIMGVFTAGVTGS